jgi:hypothetical protein
VGLPGLTNAEIVDLLERKQKELPVEEESVVVNLPANTVRTVLLNGVAAK